MLIITAAVTCSLTTREQNPNLPHTPEKIAKAAVEAYREAASVVHLHVRQAATGTPVQDVELFRETIRLIRRHCEIIVNTSTGGAPGVTAGERIAIVPALPADPQAKQETASLNT
jgi:3-keto-5-aminohexanoate cleavage enzyme